MSAAEAGWPPVAKPGTPEARAAVARLRVQQRADDAREHAAVHHGQARFAYRLAASHAGRLLHVYGVGWHWWDGSRWAADDRGEATRAVLDELRSALAESLDDRDLRADVRKAESASGVAGVLELAAALEPFAATVSDLDADPYLLNTSGGTVDLRTGQVRPCDPRDRITKVTGTGYDPAAASESWETFLAQAIPDVEVRDFLRRLIGLSLIGKTPEHVLPILTGTGRNGKGTFVRTVAAALGDYAIEAEPDLFLARDRAHPTGQMDLRGVRLATMQETDEGKRLAVGTVKRLTGGDTIRARAMRQDFVQFEPSHLAMMITNHLPKVPADDPALWARLLVVPFDMSFLGREDTTLGDRLLLELPGVLAWAVRGYGEYAARRLDPPEAVKARTRTYQVSSDAIAQFVEDKCLTVGYVRSSELWAAWTAWCRDSGEEPGGQRQFNDQLENRGYRRRVTMTGKVFDGLCLAADDEDSSHA